MIFVDDHAHAAPPLIFKAANYTAMAIDLYVTACTNNFSWKQNCEIHQRSDRNVAIHGKQNSVGGDVLRFRRASSVLRHHFDRQMQRKTWSTLHRGVVLRLRLLWNGQFVACLGCHESNKPFSQISRLRISRLRGSVHPGIRHAKLLKSWNGWVLNAFG